MSEQLDRIEDSLIRQEALLVALSEYVIEENINPARAQRDHRLTLLRGIRECREHGSPQIGR